MTNILHTSTVHNTASADKGNSAHCQSSGTHNIKHNLWKLALRGNLKRGIELRTFAHKKRCLIKILSKNLPCCKLNIIFKASCRLSSYFRFKAHPCKDLIYRIVYQFSCGGCNATYIGQSKRHLKVRISEHMGVSALTGKKSSASAPLTAVWEHMLECDHRVCSEDFSILCNAKNSFLLELKEYLFILRDNPVLNKTIRSAPLFLYT